jgi:dTDP-4-amino-4,6-dideoxygalactose transaminase
MRVPLLDLDAQYRPLRQDILAAVTRVCDSQRFIMGPEVDSLERELSDLLGVKHAIAVSSGTDALLLALMALGVKPGDEVVTTTYSFFATAGAIVRVGAKPVLVDVDPATFNIDPGQAAAAITPRTKAIMPVHLFGLGADMDPIMDAANRAGIPVIEDAAQAIGSTYHSRPLGTIGAFGCFSFFPRKYYHHLDGAKFRMDALQAAVLRVKAPHLAAWTDGRRANAARYRDLFHAAGLDASVTLPIAPADRLHIFNQFVIRTPDRDGLKRHLDERGIGNEIYYPVPFHLQPCFADLGYRQGAFPHAERAAQESLAIPVYGELTGDQQTAVVSAIGEFVQRRVPAGAGQ